MSLTSVQKCTDRNLEHTPLFNQFIANALLQCSPSLKQMLLLLELWQNVTLNIHCNEN